MSKIEGEDYWLVTKRAGLNGGEKKLSATCASYILFT